MRPNKPFECEPSTPLGAHLRKTRKQKGLSQAQVASTIGCAQGVYSDIELGYCKPRDYRIWRGIRKAFQWSPNDVIHAQNLLDAEEVTKP